MKNPLENDQRIFVCLPSVTWTGGALGSVDLLALVEIWREFSFAIRSI